jgi:cell cycle serine/threonine-protein kinase CDC5/MSD2
VENDSANTHCGTSNYMAPEILAGKHYGSSVDIWSLGILIYFMLFGEQPFRSMNKENEIEKKCYKGFDLRKEIGTKKHGLDEESIGYLADFFRRVFVIEPTKRMGLNDMINHPVFRKEGLNKCQKDTLATL